MDYLFEVTGDWGFGAATPYTWLTRAGIQGTANTKWVFALTDVGGKYMIPDKPAGTSADVTALPWP